MSVIGPRPQLVRDMVFMTKTLYPEKWKNSFGNRTDEITVFQRIHRCGNWDVLRPAQVIEGMDLISEKILKKLNDEARDLIEKMRCYICIISNFRSRIVYKLCKYIDF